jgi:hypothetical protein
MDSGVAVESAPGLPTPGDGFDPQDARSHQDVADSVHAKRNLVGIPSPDPVVRPSFECLSEEPAHISPQHTNSEGDPSWDGFVERLLATGKKHERLKRMGSISNEDGSKVTVTWRDQGLLAAVYFEVYSPSGQLVDTFDVPFEGLLPTLDAFFIGTEPLASRPRLVERLRQHHRRVSAEEYNRDPEEFWQYPWRNHRLRRHRDAEHLWSSVPPRQVRRWTRVWLRVLREIDRRSTNLTALSTDEGLLELAAEGDPRALLLLDIHTDPSLPDDDDE